MPASRISAVAARMVSAVDGSTPESVAFGQKALVLGAVAAAVLLFYWVNR